MSRDERVERFCEERSRRQGVGKGRLRYAEAVKALAVSYAESKRAEGESGYQAACDLGLEGQTLTFRFEG